MADAADLKSAVFGRAGSSPAFGTSAGRVTGSGSRRVQAGSRERPRGKKRRDVSKTRIRAEKKERRAARERAPASGGAVFPLPSREQKKTFPRDFPAGTFFQEDFALRLICGGGAKPRAPARPGPRADRTPTAPERRATRPSPCKPASSRRPACLRPCLRRRRPNPSA